MKNARKTYLEQEVCTATPQKLQLMLVEAAIKNLHLTKQLWLEERFEESLEPQSKAQSIVAEILCSLDQKKSPEIAKSLASIYVFIFRRIAEAAFERDQKYLDDAIKVLMAERQTWKEVCEKFGTTRDTTEENSVSFESKASVPAPAALNPNLRKSQTQDVSASSQGRSWDA